MLFMEDFLKMPINVSIPDNDAEYCQKIMTILTKHELSFDDCFHVLISAARRIYEKCPQG